MTNYQKAINYDDPIGVLLQLIEGGKLEVTSVSIAQITQRYLDHIQTLQIQNPEELSEFIQLGCRLMYIKSLALLPLTQSNDQKDELEQLNFELAEYHQYQILANLLQKKSTSRLWTRQSTIKLDNSDLPVPNISLDQLQAIFVKALKNADPIRPTGKIQPKLTQREIEQVIRSRLRKGPMDINELFLSLKFRHEIIVAFLAVLELIKLQVIQVIQLSQFDQIKIETHHAN